MTARLLPVTGLTVLFAACGQPDPQAPPPPEVSVVTVRSQPLVNRVQLPGRVQAVRYAEVRARVDGIVEKRLYEEGTDVQAGAELFLIDPRELRSKLNSVRATLARAEAEAANAEQNVMRYEGLVAEEAISKQEYDAAVARLRTARADVEQMRAQLESAELSLSYTRVTSPIDGRAGRARVTEGALVSASAATLLTTVEQLDPIYVNFSQSSSEILAIRREMTTGQLQFPELGNVVVKLLLEDGSPYPHPGHLNFFAMSIDEATGTAALRAVFPNPDRMLLPGQFVTANIEAGVRLKGMLIPQRAVRLATQGANVLVVNAENVAESRTVEVGTLQGSEWEVLKGLNEGERIIVDGIQKVQPGQTVRAVDASQATQAPAATPAQAPAREQ
jgi:membrane fusion protein (multidrug efflux system)